MKQILDIIFYLFLREFVKFIDGVAFFESRCHNEYSLIRRITETKQKICNIGIIIYFFIEQF